MAGADNKSGRKPTGRDAENIRQRLDALGEKLAEAKDRHGPSAAPQGHGPALGQAFRLGLELVAGVAVVFLGFGAAAGILNVVRTAKRMQAEAPSGKDLAKVDDDD